MLRLLEQVSVREGGFLRDKTGGRPHGWASLLAQTRGYPTGNGAERPVGVRLAPTGAETSE